MHLETRVAQAHLDHLAHGGVRVVGDHLVAAEHTAVPIVADARHLAREPVRRYEPRHSIGRTSTVCERIVKTLYNLIGFGCKYIMRRILNEECTLLFKFL